MNTSYRFRQHRERGLRAISLALFIGQMTTLPVSAEPWQLVDLGVDVSPADINNLGTVVGSRNTGSGSVAFRWLANGTPEDIPGSTAANAVNAVNAVNDSDQVIGNTLTGAFL
jgi:hypothetical protein